MAPSRTNILIVVGATALVVTVSFVLLLRHGFSARDEPWSIEAFLARRLRRLAIPSDVGNAGNPVTSAPAVLADGRAHFADHCAVCHANDGSGNTDIGRNLYPPAPDLREPWTQSLTDGEIFYIIHNGIRFTGMPAWGSGDEVDDQTSWKLVHFIRHLPSITDVELIEMKKMNPKTRHEIEEEEAAEKFLRGEDSDQPTQPLHHH